MNIVALDSKGAPGGFTSAKGRTYIYQTGDMSQHVEEERTFVKVSERWG